MENKVQKRKGRTGRGPGGDQEGIREDQERTRRGPGEDQERTRREPGGSQEETRREPGGIEEGARIEAETTLKGRKKGR